MTVAELLEVLKDAPADAIVVLKPNGVAAWTPDSASQRQVQKQDGGNICAVGVWDNMGVGWSQAEAVVIG